MKSRRTIQEAMADLDDELMDRLRGDATEAEATQLALPEPTPEPTPAPDKRSWEIEARITIREQ